MEIIMSQQCESLTGSLGRGFGYFIVRRKDRFYSVRSKHSVPPDGHWRFILACAVIARSNLHISDVKISREELKSALNEAHFFVAAQNLKLKTYDARDIINLKHTFGI